MYGEQARYSSLEQTALRCEIKQAWPLYRRTLVFGTVPRKSMSPFSFLKSPLLREAYESWRLILASLSFFFLSNILPAVLERRTFSISSKKGPSRE